MAVAFVVVVMQLPPQISFGRAVGLAGTLGKMNIVDFSPRLDSRYTFWSGITGGFFLAMSYFGTDQSQVQRYLSGRSITESRLGLLFNGLFKVPMQFLILFVGVMVFVFHQFQPAPIFFNQAALAAAHRSPRRASCARWKKSRRRSSRKSRRRSRAFKPRWIGATAPPSARQPTACARPKLRPKRCARRRTR